MPKDSYIFLIGLEYNTSLLPGPPFRVDLSDIKLLYGEDWFIEEIEGQSTQVRGAEGVETLYKLKKVK